jgi:hypothetical protein
MSYVTRDLLSFAVGRNAGEEVTLVTYGTFTNSGDGSYVPEITEETKLARVVDLQPNQIKRLQDKGLTVHNGVSISIVGELEKSPDKIRRSDGTEYKIIDFTISENASIFIGDLPALGEASE